MHTNLAVDRGLFVGRDEALARLGKLVLGEGEASGSALVSVVGPAGVGKSRLLRRFAHRLAHDPASPSPREVWRCELLGARQASDVLDAVAAVLGLEPGAARTRDAAATQLAAALAARPPTLLVLDHAEPVLAELAPLVTQWLDAAPRLQLVLGSRERLRVHGERVLELLPLATTAPCGDDEGAPAPASALFLELARTLAPDLELRPEELAVVDAIVRRLDGLPLAIELAATQTRLLSPQQILERLDGTLREAALGAAFRDAPAHHASLRDALDASWSLLDDAERDALCALAVFVGGFEPDAVATVLAARAAAHGRDPLALLLALREKSLVQRADAEPGPEAPRRRFALLQTVRHFALAHLARQPWASEPRRAWLHHFAALARDACARLDTEADARARRELERARPDLLAICNQHLAAEGPEPDDDLSRCDALDVALGLLAARPATWPAERALALAEAALHTAARLEPGSPRATRLRTRLELARATALREAGQLDAALAAAQRLHDALGEDTSEPALRAEVALHALHTACSLGDLAQARAWYALADPAQDALDEHQRGIAWRLGSVLALLQDEHRLAAERAARALEHLERGARPPLAALARLDLAWLLASRGELEQAEQAVHAVQATLAAQRPAVRLAWHSVAARVHLVLRRHEACRGLLDALAALAERCGNALVGYHVLKMRLWLMLDEAPGDTASWRPLVEAASTALERLGPVHGDALLQGCAALLAARHGELSLAGTLAQAASEAALRGSSREARVFCCGLHAMLRQRSGDARGAGELLEAARAGLAGEDEQGQVLYGLWRALCSQCDARDALAAALREREPARASLVDSNYGVRIVAQLAWDGLDGSARRAVVASARDPGGEALLFDASGWCRPPGEVAWHDLSSRALMVRLLSALVEQRATSPDGGGLERDALLEAGWPGERIALESALNRLYKSLSELRRLGGLERVLLKGDAGYRLDPAVKLVQLGPRL